MRGEVKGEVEQLREKRTCAWREDGMTDSRDDLGQCGCDTCVMKTRHLTACRRAQTSRMLCLCLLVYVMSLLSLSTLVLKVYLSSSSFAKPFVRELLYQEMFSLHFLCGFAFAFGWITNSSAFRCNACSSS